MYFVITTIHHHHASVKHLYYWRKVTLLLSHPSLVINYFLSFCCVCVYIMCRFGFSSIMYSKYVDIKLCILNIGHMKSVGLGILWLFFLHLNSKIFIYILNVYFVLWYGRVGVLCSNINNNNMYIHTFLKWWHILIHMDDKLTTKNMHMHMDDICESLCWSYGLNCLFFIKFSNI